MTETFRPAGFIGSSMSITAQLDLAGRLAGSKEPLFLYGESGTGKDLFARALHAARCDDPGPFVILNAGSMPDDLLDRELLGCTGDPGLAPHAQVPRSLAPAQGGTLYLDDICRAPERGQALLAEFLRQRRVRLEDGREVAWQGRIVAASNRDPRAAIAAGAFRRDLFDLLAVGYLELPPLRNRPGDAVEIAETLYPRFLADLGLPPQDLPQRVLARIDTLPWPGNVRQLVNTLRRMALSPDAALGLAPDVPPDVRADAYPPGVGAEVLTFAEIERRAILAAIERNQGSIPRASAELELAASTIYRKLKSWHL